MRRVYFTYVMRRALHPLMMKVYALFAVFVGLSVFTSLGNVVENAPHDLGALYTFSTYAFLNTQAAVQALVVGGVCVLVWLFADMLRSLAVPRTSRAS